MIGMTAIYEKKYLLPILSKWEFLVYCLTIQELQEMTTNQAPLMHEITYLTYTCTSIYIQRATYTYVTNTLTHPPHPIKLKAKAIIRPSINRQRPTPSG